jgi:DNA-binding response OmpR family regulator
MEGLTQMLAGGGHRVQLAHSIDEAEEIALRTPPLLAVLDRATVPHDGGASVGQIALAPGGAYVLYRTTSHEGAPPARAIARHTLADLTLPLERYRLLALAQYVSARARESGRARLDTPPDHRVV